MASGEGSAGGGGGGGTALKVEGSVEDAALDEKVDGALDSSREVIFIVHVEVVIDACDGRSECCDTVEQCDGTEVCEADAASEGCTT